MNQYIDQLKKDGKLNRVFYENLYQLPKKPFIISGPCSVESEPMICRWAKKMKELGVEIFMFQLAKPESLEATLASMDRFSNQVLSKF